MLIKMVVMRLLKLS